MVAFRRVTTKPAPRNAVRVLSASPARAKGVATVMMKTGIIRRDGDEEALTVASEPSIEESKEDKSNYLIDVDLNAQAMELIQSDPCESGCVRGKARAGRAQARAFARD
ncbi:hypothetical protein PF008_g20329 [Phytophthora fragariae]|uniref:Uncharacterized protein n=1 Tax=Phytophthora fragariae TaxID=53985 RepID=A0A6G0R0K8_9STRA|nr:hypothetical protein PF008_g20329 [Phytophthora fragariae]